MDSVAVTENKALLWFRSTDIGSGVQSIKKIVDLNITREKGKRAFWQIVNDALSQSLAEQNSMMIKAIVTCL